MEGPACAECKAPTGLIMVNGHSVQVDPTAVVGSGVMVFTIHRCGSKA